MQRSLFAVTNLHICFCVTCACVSLHERIKVLQASQNTLGSGILSWKHKYLKEATSSQIDLQKMCINCRPLASSQFQ